MTIRHSLAAYVLVLSASLALALFQPQDAPLHIGSGGIEPLQVAALALSR